MLAIQKDPSFTSKTTLIRRKINVCLQFPTQSSLLCSQVGSLGSLWSPSNCEGGRSSTLQVFALCRAEARLEQLPKAACTTFKDKSKFFQEDNSNVNVAWEDLMWWWRRPVSEYMQGFTLPSLVLLLNTKVKVWVCARIYISVCSRCVSDWC